MKDIPLYHNHIIYTIAKVLRHGIAENPTDAARAQEHYDSIVNSPHAISYVNVFEDKEFAWIVARALDTYAPVPGMELLYLDNIVDILVDILPENYKPRYFLEDDDISSG